MLQKTQTDYDRKGAYNMKFMPGKTVSSAAFFTFALLLGSLMFTPAAYATNGMNLEGYGPIATGMGGASMAYDNGTAAMMNNPATLSLMEAQARLDVALGFLGPNIETSVPGMSAASSSDLFVMPAFGYARKSGQYTYGLGVFAQGGMGTHYSANSFMAAGSGDAVMSQVSMGRLLIPVAYDVDDRLKIGATVDFVWASMDLKMALDPNAFGDLVGPAFGGSQTFGTVSGTMVDNLLGAFTPGSCGPGVACLSSLNWARFDFADDSSFSGKAKGNGFAGKIGGVYQVNDEVSVGIAYHSKTSIGDLEASGATMSMEVTGTATGGIATKVPVTGTIKVKDFQWPQMLTLGTAYKVSPKLFLVFDYKWINWKDVMKDFNMTFTADANQPDPTATAFGLGGTVADATLYQNWKDQNVFMLGAAFRTTEELTLRAGLNIANNPVPDFYENPLFPATIKNHVMLGAGYAIDDVNSVDASITYAPEVEVTNGGGVTTTHSQMNSQIMYSYRF